MKKSPDTQNPTCHIHDNCAQRYREGFNNLVCKDLELIEHTNGKRYCILHFPTKDKDISEFNKVFQSRLKDIDNKILEIEKKYAKQEFQTAHFEQSKNGELKLQKYYFPYVWFPSKVELKERIFKAEVDFQNATFSSDASFDGSSFLGGTNFSFAVFSAKVTFSKSVFAEFAYFDKTIFEAEVNLRESNFTAPWVNFGRTVFTSNAYFDSTIFSSNISFETTQFLSFASFQRSVFSGNTNFFQTIFAKTVHFENAKFLENSQIEFHGTRFCSSVDFNNAEFNGYVKFTLNCFRNLDEVKEIKNWIKTDKISDEQEASLSLKEAKFNRPTRISFNSLTLRPSWFVDAEVRSLVFNDVKWLNLEVNIDVDISGLNKIRLNKPNESLLKAFNQIADNAEANHRFEEAKLFRKQLIALKGHKCYVADGIDKSEKEYIQQNVCGDYPVVNEDGGQYYCLWHNPDKNKAETFREEFEKRRLAKHFDFSYVIFPIDIRYDNNLPNNLNFKGARFQRRVVFHEAKINNIDFSESYFEEKAELLFEYSNCEGRINFEKVVFDGKFNLNGNNGYFFLPQKEV